ncbi:unnamed protein product [Pleuronectes platessa]|uniref:Uncharacterized protein n=1 Tax=Pleuronectes platessa TaxID=8262 RepID=A0A9N7UCA5_PLEPL|nr:unnamed protein product [Pleuronectes platessa]
MEAPTRLCLCREEIIGLTCFRGEKPVIPAEDRVCSEEGTAGGGGGGGGGAGRSLPQRDEDVRHGQQGTGLDQRGLKHGKWEKQKK